MISWKAREASACEAHAARRYNLSSLRPQEQATYKSCAILGLPRGTQYLVHWITNHARQFFTLVAWRRLHSWRGLDPGRIGGLRTAAGASGLARRADGSCSQNGAPPPLGQASHTPRRQSGPWSSGGGVAGSPRRWPPLVYSVTCSADSDAVGRGRLAAASFDKEGQHRTTGTEGWACKAANSCS
jgi:hypothetical protein